MTCLLHMLDMHKAKKARSVFSKINLCAGNVYNFVIRCIKSNIVQILMSRLKFAHPSCRVFLQLTVDNRKDLLLDIETTTSTPPACKIITHTLVFS